MLKLPSQYHLSPIVMDVANIQMFMSMQIKVTLTLAKVLNFKPKLWQEVTKCLDKMGIPVPALKPI